MRIAVLGGGPGGYVAALKAARLGAQVTVVEEDEVGGTCLNRGCIPTKALLASAEAFHRAKTLSDYGIDLSGTASPNLQKILDRKDRVVSTQVKGIRALFKSWGVTLVEGRGNLTDPRTISVTLRDGAKAAVSADAVIIATGSRPAEIPAFQFDGDRVLSSTDALRLGGIPKSLLIVGAGVIGSEFACIFNELGTEVTMVEMLPRAVSTEDPEVSELLEREFKKKKVRLLTGVGVDRIEHTADGVRSFLSNGQELVTEKVLVSIGRALNSAGIGLEALGIATGKRGEILVNERMETNVAGVYAVGDVTGKMLLAHVASAGGLVAARNATGDTAVLDTAVVPAAIFTLPEIASVGLRENQAAEQGLNVNIGRFQFRGLGKAHAMGEITGFAKLVADASTDRVVGAHIVGAHAADLIHEAALAIRNGLKVRDITATIHAHPTLSEGILEAAEDAHGAAIHTLKK